MVSDIKKFRKGGLHCAVADPRKIIPRPLVHQMHAQKRNEILHYDFIKIVSSRDGFLYILVIKDDCSSFVDMIPCIAPDAHTVVNALLRWYRPQNEQGFLNSD